VRTRKNRCPNFNHGRLNVPVRFCLNCGEVVNKNQPVKTCSEMEHAAKKRQRKKYCVDCGTQLIAGS
jgi:hypothetical protein